VKFLSDSGENILTFNLPRYVLRRDLSVYLLDIQAERA